MIQDYSINEIAEKFPYAYKELQYIYDSYLPKDPITVVTHDVKFPEAKTTEEAYFTVQRITIFDGNFYSEGTIILDDVDTIIIKGNLEVANVHNNCGKLIVLGETRIKNILSFDSNDGGYTELNIVEPVNLISTTANVFSVNLNCNYLYDPYFDLQTAGTTEQNGHQPNITKSIANWNQTTFINDNNKALVKVDIDKYQISSLLNEDAEELIQALKVTEFPAVEISEKQSLLLNMISARYFDQIEKAEDLVKNVLDKKDIKSFFGEDLYSFLENLYYTIMRNFNTHNCLNLVELSSPLTKLDPYLCYPRFLVYLKENDNTKAKEELQLIISLYESSIPKESKTFQSIQKFVVSDSEDYLSENFKNTKEFQDFKSYSF